jgi:diacylglycerol kinase (ATP)
MKQKNFSIKKRMQSFKYAFNGLRILLCEESNAWIHFCIAICVIAAGFVFKISTTEWIIVVFCIGFVFALELLNSAIENMADFVSKEYHDLIKKTKDLAAGAVLVGAIASAIIGLIIFTPKIIGLLC